MSSAQRAMRLSLVEGLFYAFMVGCGEAYFLADAVRLGASSLAQGLVVTLPLFVGAAGSLLALAALARCRHRKPVVVTAALVQATLLAVLAVADHRKTLSPAALIALACAYQMCAQAAGTAWSSWYGDVVPPEIRGRYFARRNRMVQLATCVALATCGVLLQRLEPGAAGEVEAGAGGSGYVLIFALAAGSRLVSAVLLMLAPEPHCADHPPVGNLTSMLVAADALPVRRLLLVACIMSLLVHVSSPYFAPFVLEELRMSYLEYTAGNMAVVLLKFASLSAWGRVIDHHGARPVYLLGAVLISIVPLPWLWASGLGWVVFAQMLSGFSWGGYEVSQFSLLLETSEARVRAHVFAALGMLTGMAQFVGSMAGAALLALTDRSFRLVFAISMIGRLLVAMAIPRALPADALRPHIGRKTLLLRVIGMRPSGGVDHRPLPVDDEDGR